MAAENKALLEHLQSFEMEYAAVTSPASTSSSSPCCDAPTSLGMGAAMTRQPSNCERILKAFLDQQVRGSTLIKSASFSCMYAYTCSPNTL